MTICRVCNVGGVSSLPIAVYAPFFEKRVDVGKDRFALYSANGGLRPYGFTLPARIRQVALQRMKRIFRFRSAAFLRTSCDFCQTCQSITPSHSYSHDDLSGLYVDYRSATYNADRVAVEPSYRRLADLVGRSPTEQKNRNEGVAAFLSAHLDHMEGATGLDLGGSDGKFIPLEVVTRLGELHIFDASDAHVDERVAAHRVTKVDAPREGAYGLLMCMHVLEHVGDPRGFIVDALRYLAPGGYLYLEVPLELDSATVEQFRTRSVDRCITIHEHLNQFEGSSLLHLIASVQSLRTIKSEAAAIDCGWTTSRVGRYLAQSVL